jgi:hypothetical protein
MFLSSSIFQLQRKGRNFSIFLNVLNIRKLTKRLASYIGSGQMEAELHITSYFQTFKIHILKEKNIKTV